MIRFLDSEGKQNAAVFFMLAIVVLVLGSAYFYISSYDEGVYLLISKKMMDGWIPYRDIAENKPPGLYLLLIPAVLFAGTSMLMLRLYGYMFTLLGSYIIFLIGKRIGNEKIGLFASFVYIMLVFHPAFQAFGLMTEPPSNLFVFGIVYLLLNKKTELHWILIGVMAAIAVSIKQTAVFVFIPIAYSLVMERDELQRKNIGALLLGSLLFAVPIFAYFVFNNALYDAFNCLVLVPLEIGGSSLISKLYLFIIILISLCPLFLYAGIGYLEVEGHKRGLLVSWLIGAFILIQFGYSHQRYYLYLVPPLLILAGLGVEKFFKMSLFMGGRKSVIWTSLLLLSMGFFLLQFFFPVLFNIYGVWEHGKADEINYYPDVISVVSFIKNNTAPNEKIFVFRVNVEIYYFSGRDPVVKRPFLFGGWLGKLDERQLKEYLLDPLVTESPRYVIVNRIDANLSKKYAEKNVLRFESFLNERYELDRQIGMYDIYMLKPR